MEPEPERQVLSDHFHVEPEAVAVPIDQAALRECIDAQRCPWCGREGLRSLANHTVMVHRIYADELREMAGLPAGASLCSPELSDRHRQLARDQDTLQWLHRGEVWLAGAATREANYDDDQRKRRLEQLNAVRAKAAEALRQWRLEEKNDPDLAAQRRIARSKAHRAFRPGVECPICGAWFCPLVPPGQDYRKRKYCSDNCRIEAFRRVRHRTLMRRALQAWDSATLSAR